MPPRWIPAALLTGAIVSEVSATLALKGALHHVGLYVVVVVGYLGSFYFLHLLLKRGAEVGTVYGIWSAFGVVLAALGSWALFHEPMTWPMVAGMALIIVGVLFVEMGGRAHGASVVEETTPEASR